jgi:hypothetical protein
MSKKSVILKVDSFTHISIWLSNNETETDSYQLTQRM